jgi:hypothetical protein
MTEYQRSIVRMYLLPILTSAGVFCTTVVSSVGTVAADAAIPRLVWWIAAGQALGVLGAGLTQAYLHAPTPEAPPTRASGGV